MRAEPVEINPVDNARVDKSLTCTRADFEYVVPSYAEMVCEMRRWIMVHQKWYPHYLNR